MKVNINDHLVDLSLVIRITPLEIDRQYGHWNAQFTIYFLNDTTLRIHYAIGIYTGSLMGEETQSTYTIYSPDKGEERVSQRSTMKLHELNAHLENTEPGKSCIATLRKQYEELIALWNKSEPRYPKLKFGLV